MAARAWTDDDVAKLLVATCSWKAGVLSPKWHTAMTGFLGAVATKGAEAPIPTARLWLRQETEKLAGAPSQRRAFPAHGQAERRRVMTARVIPFPGVAPKAVTDTWESPEAARIAAAAQTRCPVCDEPNGGESYTCETCAAMLHRECYYGRVMPLEEWRAFRRWLDESAMGEPAPATRCGACRKAGA